MLGRDSRARRGAKRHRHGSHHRNAQEVAIWEVERDYPRVTPKGLEGPIADAYTPPEIVWLTGLPTKTKPPVGGFRTGGDMFTQQRLVAEGADFFPLFHFPGGRLRSGRERLDAD